MSENEIEEEIWEAFRQVAREESLRWEKKLRGHPELRKLVIDVQRARRDPKPQS